MRSLVAASAGTHGTTTVYTVASLEASKTKKQSEARKRLQRGLLADFKSISSTSRGCPARPHIREAGRLNISACTGVGGKSGCKDCTVTAWWLKLTMRRCTAWHGCEGPHQEGKSKTP